MPITGTDMVTVKLHWPWKGPVVDLRLGRASDVAIPAAFVVRSSSGVKKGIAAGKRTPVSLPPMGPQAGIFASAAPVPKTFTNPLAGDATPAVSPEVAQFLGDLCRQLALGDLLEPDQKVFLERLAGLVGQGRARLDQLLESIWKMLSGDFLHRAESLGAVSRKVIRDDHCYTRIDADFSNSDILRLLGPLLTVLLAIQFKAPHLPPLVGDGKSDTAIFLPTWKTLMALYRPHMADVVWIAKQLDMDALIPFLEADRATILVPVDFLQKWLIDLDAVVHPMVFVIYELYHAIRSTKSLPEHDAVTPKLRRIDALWELLELDLAMRAIQAGATVRIEEGVIVMTADIGNRKISGLMTPILHAMRGVKKKMGDIFSARLEKKTWVFELRRWSQVRDATTLPKGERLHDYLRTLYVNVVGLTETFDRHPLADAWETVAKGE